MRAPSIALRAIVLAVIIAQPVMAGQPLAATNGDENSSRPSGVGQTAPFSPIKPGPTQAPDAGTTSVDGSQVVLIGGRTVRLPAFESPFEVARRAG